MSADSGFPVVWTVPGDERLQWMFFQQSFPNQVPPLEFDVHVMHTMEGGEHAFAALRGNAHQRISTRRFNTYVYRAMASADPADEPPHGGENAGILASVDDLPRAWREDYQPRLQEFLDEFGAVDLGELSTSDLFAHFEKASAEMKRLWELHFLILFPSLAVVNEFERTYRTLFGGDVALDPYRLLGGLPNKTVEAGRAMWDLAKRLDDLPSARKIVEETPPEEAVAALRADED